MLILIHDYRTSLHQSVCIFYQYAVLTCRQVLWFLFSVRVLMSILNTLPLSIFLTGVTAKEKKKPEDSPSDDDVLIVYELTPTAEQKALATKLKLPPTFFCYKNRPDYVSEEEEDGKTFVISKTLCSCLS